jgi:GT2 family glycosyltransferase
MDEFTGHLKNFSKDLTGKNFQFEVIAIANDATQREQRFADDFKNEPWFKFISVGREPLYATWNRGVGMAKGEAVGFWNVDDIRFPEALVEADRLFLDGADVVYFPFKIDRYMKILGKSFLIHKQLINKQVPENNQTTKKEFQRSMLCGPFFLFLKKFYEKVGPFDEQFKIAGDFDWCVRAAKASDKLVKAKSLGGEFRVDGSGLSAGGKLRHVTENNLIYKRHGITDKIKDIDQSLIGQYNFKVIKAGSEELPYV